MIAIDVVDIHTHTNNVKENPKWMLKHTHWKKHTFYFEKKEKRKYTATKKIDDDKGIDGGKNGEKSVFDIFQSYHIIIKYNNSNLMINDDYAL